VDDLPSQLESLRAQIEGLQASLVTVLWLSVLVSVVFAAVSAYIAARKGYSPVRWAALGAFLGPVAVVGVLFLPSVRAATKACPDCAETVKAEAAKCRFCGYRFDQSASTASPSAGPNERNRLHE
jgi:hypothetical protein